MPFFIGIDILPFLTTVFWVWMLVDCVLNKRLSNGSKIGWVLFIFFTHIVGAIVYFFTTCSRKNPFEAFPYYIATISKMAQPQGNSPQQPSQPQQPPPRAYPDYQEGYQAQQPLVPTQEESPYHMQPEYEHPTATYPEMPMQER